MGLYIHALEVEQVHAKGSNAHKNLDGTLRAQVKGSMLFRQQLVYWLTVCNDIYIEHYVVFEG